VARRRIDRRRNTSAHRGVRAGTAATDRPLRARRPRGVCGGHRDRLGRRGQLGRHRQGRQARRGSAARQRACSGDLRVRQAPPGLADGRAGRDLLRLRAGVDRPGRTDLPARCAPVRGAAPVVRRHRADAAPGAWPIARPHLALWALGHGVGGRGRLARAMALHPGRGHPVHGRVRDRAGLPRARTRALAGSRTPAGERRVDGRRVVGRRGGGTRTIQWGGARYRARCSRSGS
jgi:hypothetical protein